MPTITSDTLLNVPAQAQAACSSCPTLCAKASVNEVQQFLTTAGLDHEYAAAFVEHGFDRMAAIQLLTKDDLEAMHVKPGHAKLLLTAIASLATKKAVTAPAVLPITYSAPTVKLATPSVNIDVAAFVRNELPHLRYEGDCSFLAPATEKTKAVWAKCLELIVEEHHKGILDCNTNVASTITSFGPGYISKENEVVVGLQTDAPLRRAVKPQGGVRIVKDALEAYGYKLDPKVDEIYTKYRKTHNQGVFDVYTPEMRAARSAGILTGLPDAYGRGRIIGDYRRVALYGIDALVSAKKQEHDSILTMTEDAIRLSEELTEQMRALGELKQLGKMHGFDLSKPAQTAQEAVQWLYLAYLSAIKEQDGAAMSMGRIDVFLDSYIQRDLDKGVLTEAGAQELVDQLIIKMRLVRHLRPPAYNALFAGDPVWVTCVLGGIGLDGQHMVTKTAFRILHTLINLGPAPEPNLTILWDPRLPPAFKRFCAHISVLTSSIQYENDTLMQPRFGSDYGIACCVSAMAIGKDMQFFGARCNLPKLLLYVMNEGRDEVSGEQVAPKGLFPRLSSTTAVAGGKDEKPLEYAEVKESLEHAMDWLTGLYVNTMNVIHFMHDKYNYERIQMALHDSHVRRFLAFGVAGLSVLTDSLSAIKHCKVYAIRDAKGIAKEFSLSSSEFPKYGNDNDTVDTDAVWAVQTFSKKLHTHPTYRGSLPTLSVLTITSNVVYGQHTGDTPDGRKKGEPFAPGANPMHGRDSCGCLASLNSVAKLPYECCLDGISNTFCIVPQALGKDETARLTNLVTILDGYISKGGHHLNVNVLNREVLLDAVAHPEKYPQLTIRVSGYAVHFHRLTTEQKNEVIARTFHESLAGIIDVPVPAVSACSSCPCSSC